MQAFLLRCPKNASGYRPSSRFSTATPASPRCIRHRRRSVTLPFTQGSQERLAQAKRKKALGDCHVLFYLLFWAPYGTLTLRHKSISAHFGEVFLLSVKTLAPLFTFLGVCQKICVAAIGAVRFSVRGFGCALFIGGTKKWVSIILCLVICLSITACSNNTQKRKKMIFQKMSSHKQKTRYKTIITIQQKQRRLKQ